MPQNWVELATVLGVAGVVSGEEYRARCPLHNDTRPSFSMNVNTGNFICHTGCGKGEFTRLVELVLGCSSQAARQWVKDNGKQAAIEFISRQLIQTMQLEEKNTKSLSRHWLTYYESLSSKTMPIWFLERGFSWNTINHWGIRYDRLQDAVIIPVKHDGQFIGIISRNFSRQPKYQNSEGLKKSEILFGEINPNENVLILVEGVFDAIWLWQLGYNAVSLLGHDLSKKQTLIIRSKRFGEVCLALDNDAVGRSGTSAAIMQLQKAGYLLPQITYLQYPPNRKDAQDCTPEELEAAYSKRKERSLELLTIS